MHMHMHTHAHIHVHMHMPQTVRREFDETRPLYLAGAMLTRTQPPSSRGEGPSTYDPGVAHVDRANMSSYDYSAVAVLAAIPAGQGRGVG